MTIGSDDKWESEYVNGSFEQCESEMYLLDRTLRCDLVKGHEGNHMHFTRHVAWTDKQAEESWHSAPTITSS